MKRHISLFVFFCLPGVFLAGCSDADRSSLMGEEEVPVELSALEGDVSSRAAVSAGSNPQAEFEAAMVFSRTGGDYTTPVVAAEEGVWKGTVGTDGKVGWGNAGKDAPIYPRWGAWLYLVSYAPYAEPDKAASGSGTGTYAGTVSFVLTGQTDLLYASQIQGNRWADGHFPSLVFDHQLTQLSFQAKKTLQNGVSVWVKSITVKEAKPLASLKLATGEVTFSTTTEHPQGLTVDLTQNGTNGAGQGTEVTGQTPVSVGQLLLPPLEAGGNNGNGGGSNTYTLKVETSIGIFDNVSLTFGDSNASGKNPLQAGMSHAVTLNIGDHELGITSVTVQAWTPVTVDGTLDAD